MDDFDSRVETMVNQSVAEGLRDEVAIGLIHGFAHHLFDPLARKKAVLACVRRILTDDLMVMTSSVDGDYVPHQGTVDDLVGMVETNFPYEEDGVTYRKDFIFLYWFINTDAGDARARELD